MSSQVAGCWGSKIWPLWGPRVKPLPCPYETMKEALGEKSKTKHTTKDSVCLECRHVLVKELDHSKWWVIPQLCSVCGQEKLAREWLKTAWQRLKGIMTGPKPVNTQVCFFFFFFLLIQDWEVRKHHPCWRLTATARSVGHSPATFPDRAKSSHSSRVWTWLCVCS